MLKPVTAIAALVVASALVVPTVSQAEDTSSVRVSYADLDLASGVGQHTLQGRITDAAHTVCVWEDTKELQLGSEVKACRSDAVASAQPAYEAAVSAARHGTVIIGAGAALTVAAR
jgi:UrcA family protein